MSDVMPYYDYAHKYVKAGWWPLPATEEKHGIPTGYTGYKGKAVTRSEVDTWANKSPKANIALRLPRDLVALDVDAYGDKPGAKSLANLEVKHGKLPDTFAATARDLPSAKYLFRVPAGTRLKGKPADGIEVCQFHHRYVMAWPSLHHTGATVQWIDTLSGGPLNRIPDLDEFPDLPWSWIEGLSVTGSGEIAPDATSTEVTAWMDRCTDNRAPVWLESLVARASKNAKANRHDTILMALCDVTREAEVGAYPAKDAVEQLRTIFDNNDHGNADSFDSMLSFAVGQLNAENAEARLKIAHDRLEDFTTDWLANFRDGETVNPETGEILELAVPESVDDSSMAEAFSHTIRGQYLYVAAWRKWLRWDGRRWADDITEAVLEEARQWVIDLGKHLLDQNADSKLIGSVAKYRTKARTDAIATMARRIDGIAATPAEFDADPDLLNVANGVIDLRTGKLNDHDPALRIRELADTEYNPDANHNDVEAVLEVVAPDVRDWLQRLLGYGITGHTHEDVVPVSTGGGGNGKSTLFEAVGAALGGYAAAAPAKLIMRTHNDEHPTIKADLMGKRLVWISETEEGGSLRMEQLKALTGGDRIKARFMRADYFEFTPTHTLVIATNHRPNVNSTEHAAWRRLRLVPFPYTYRNPEDCSGDDRPIDKRLRVRLRDGKAQRSAMLAWLVAGAVRWHVEGLGECPTVTEATSQWRRSEDVILRFIEDRLRLGGDARTRGNALWNEYRDWCDEEGRNSGSNKNFAAKFLAHEDVQNAGVEVVRPQNVAHYIGVETRGITAI